jgi:hypothetical protein
MDTTTGRQAPREPQWVGPLAFHGIAGDPGADREFGMRWGERHDQRIALRCTPGASRGLLYAYDPLWDEYAVLGRDVHVSAVDAASKQALDMDIHMRVLEFAELVRCHQILGSTTAVHHDRVAAPELGIGR